jgi:hypothetical protein
MSTIKSSAENLTLNADGANNDVIIQSNGSTKVTVDGQNSRVGIGVAAPAEMLEIYNTSSPAIQLNDGGDYKSIFRMAGNDLEIRGSSGSLEFYNGSADGDSSAQRMTINASGNVGIGIVTPARTLHVNSADANVASFEGHQGEGLVISSGTNGQIDIIGYDDGASAYNPIAIRSASAGGIFLDTTGAVTMPAQPCVSARASYTNIPINTLTVITLDSERFDIGNNLASSTFTAPVTGKYLYTYTLYYADVDSAATALGVQTVTSNKTYEQWITPDHIANSDFSYTMTSSHVADMDANDTLQFKAYCGGGAAQTDVHADSHISIALIA